jgi:hypothetical protein
VAGGLHSGNTGLDAFADHQQAIGWLTEVDCAAATRPEHHSLWFYGCLAFAIAGKEGAVDT